MEPTFPTNIDSLHEIPKGQRKPDADVRRIIDHLLPAAIPVVMPAGGGEINLYAKSKHKDDLWVVLLLEGQIDFIRTSSGNILFGAAYGPSVLGLMNSTFRADVFRYMAVGQCNIYTIPRDRAIDLVNEHNLAREVLSYQAYISDMAVRYSNRLINKTTYEMVCLLLSELASLPESVRLKTSAAQFILDRSKMGRSGMMRILSDLRKGEYVDIQNGKLVKILKKFPKYY